jgi:hypothetical protein
VLSEALERHDRPEPASPRCAATKKDGRPCRALARTGSYWCIFHDPSLAAEAAAARRLGGEHRRRTRLDGGAREFTGFGNAAAVQRVLEIAVGDVLDLEPSLERARVLISAAGAAMRLLELSTLEARLSRLETAFDAVGPSLQPTSRSVDPAAVDLLELDE